MAADEDETMSGLLSVLNPDEYDPQMLNQALAMLKKAKLGAAASSSASASALVTTDSKLESIDGDHISAGEPDVHLEPAVEPFNDVVEPAIASSGDEAEPATVPSNDDIERTVAQSSDEIELDASPLNYEADEETLPSDAEADEETTPINAEDKPATELRKDGIEPEMATCDDEVELMCVYSSNEMESASETLTASKNEIIEPATAPSIEEIEPISVEILDDDEDVLEVDLAEDAQSLLSENHSALIDIEALSELGSSVVIDAISSCVSTRSEDAAKDDSVGGFLDSWPHARGSMNDDDDYEEGDASSYSLAEALWKLEIGRFPTVVVDRIVPGNYLYNSNPCPASKKMRLCGSANHKRPADDGETSSKSSTGGASFASATSKEGRVSDVRQKQKDHHHHHHDLHHHHHHHHQRRAMHSVVNDKQMKVEVSVDRREDAISRCETSIEENVARTSSPSYNEGKVNSSEEETPAQEAGQSRLTEHAEDDMDRKSPSPVIPPRARCNSAAARFAKTRDCDGEMSDGLRPRRSMSVGDKPRTSEKIVGSTSIPPSPSSEAGLGCAAENDETHENEVTPHEGGLEEMWSSVAEMQQPSEMPNDRVQAPSDEVDIEVVEVVTKEQVPFNCSTTSVKSASGKVDETRKISSKHKKKKHHHHHHHHHRHVSYSSSKHGKIGGELEREAESKRKSSPLHDVVHLKGLGASKNDNAVNGFSSKMQKSVLSDADLLRKTRDYKLRKCKCLVRIEQLHPAVVKRLAKYRYVRVGSKRSAAESSPPMHKPAIVRPDAPRSVVKTASLKQAAQRADVLKHAVHKGDALKQAVHNADTPKRTFQKAEVLKHTIEKADALQPPVEETESLELTVVKDDAQDHRKDRRDLLKRKKEKDRETMRQRFSCAKLISKLIPRPQTPEPGERKVKRRRVIQILDSSDEEDVIKPHEEPLESAAPPVVVDVPPPPPPPSVTTDNVGLSDVYGSFDVDVAKDTLEVDDFLMSGNNGLDVPVASFGGDDDVLLQARQVGQPADAVPTFEDDDWPMPCWTSSAEVPKVSESTDARFAEDNITEYERYLADCDFLGERSPNKDAFEKSQSRKQGTEELEVQVNSIVNPSFLNHSPVKLSPHNVMLTSYVCDVSAAKDDKSPLAKSSEIAECSASLCHSVDSQKSNMAAAPFAMTTDLEVTAATTLAAASESSHPSPGSVQVQADSDHSCDSRDVSESVSQGPAPLQVASRFRQPERRTSEQLANGTAVWKFGYAPPIHPISRSSEPVCESAQKRSKPVSDTLMNGVTQQTPAKTNSLAARIAKELGTTVTDPVDNNAVDADEDAISLMASTSFNESEGSGLSKSKISCDDHLFSAVAISPSQLEDLTVKDLEIMFENDVYLGEHAAAMNVFKVLRLQKEESVGYTMLMSLLKMAVDSEVALQKEFVGQLLAFGTEMTPLFGPVQKQIRILIAMFSVFKKCQLPAASAAKDLHNFTRFGGPKYGSDLIRPPSNINEVYNEVLRAAIEANSAELLRLYREACDAGVAIDEYNLRTLLVMFHSSNLDSLVNELYRIGCRMGVYQRCKTRPPWIKLRSYFGQSEMNIIIRDFFLRLAIKSGSHAIAKTLTTFVAIEELTCPGVPPSTMTSTNSNTSMIRTINNSLQAAVSRVQNIIVKLSDKGLGRELLHRDKGRVLIIGSKTTTHLMYNVLKEKSCETNDEWGGPSKADDRRKSASRDT